MQDYEYLGILLVDDIDGLLRPAKHLRMNPGGTPVTSQGPVDDNSSSPGSYPGGYPTTCGVPGGNTFPQGYYTQANAGGSYQDTFGSKYYPTGYPYGPGSAGGPPGGSSGGPEDPVFNNGRDLNYYGYNNGFGSGGGDGGGFFVSSQPGSVAAVPQDNNNKLSDSNAGPTTADFGDTKAKEEGLANCKLAPQAHTEGELKSFPKSDTTDNSDNQERSQDMDDTLKRSNSPNTASCPQGLKRSLSPSSTDNPDQPFEPHSNMMANDDFLRQQQLGMGSNEGKENLVTINITDNDTQNQQSCLMKFQKKLAIL